ncbi:glycosyltransferase [Chryseobacterium sp.]|uniref:glycosyltransferase n=1 Tax=Chryseobacterium sp. TaxID=1871047 RepID=UPI00321B9DF8
MSKKILFVCYGDSNSPKAWSNVPFLFSENLKMQGYEILRVDLSPSKKYETLWNKYPGRILSRFFPNQQYEFIKTPISRMLAYKKIKKVVKNNPDLYFVIILSFDFYNKFSNTPSLLFHDWSYDMVILDRLKREPYFFEKWFIKYQHKAFNNSELVISLFKDAQKLISERHGKQVHHLGSNVVNDINFNKPTFQEILEKKKKSEELLLIGSMKYLLGARKLVEAVRILQKDFPNLTLNIINIPKDRLLLQDTDRNIICYEYLDKGDPEQNIQYYNLVTKARILVNPSEIWAAYSSTIECMFYYTPIIIKPYEAFALDYGEESDFGIYLQNTEVSDIVDSIRTILTMNEEEYTKLCLRAHELVKDQTWETYTKKVIELMNKVVNKN